MAYDSPRYQLEKTLIYPLAADLTFAGDVGKRVANRHIHIGKLGIIISADVSGATTAPVVAILEGAVELAALTIPDGTLTGEDVSIDTDITAIAAGNTILFNVKTAADTAGGGYIYITYKERFSL